MEIVLQLQQKTNVPDTEPVESRPHSHILFFKIYLSIILRNKYNGKTIIRIN
jgi:hypothetical protein